MKKIIIAALIAAVLLLCCELFTLSPNAPSNPLDPNNPSFIEIPLTALSLAGAEGSMARTEEFELAVEYTPANTTQRGVTWESSNEGVFSVDAFGKVTVKSSGTAEITLTSADNNSIFDICSVTVNTDSIVIADYVYEPPTYVVGDSETFTLSTASFDMIYVPGGITFPTGVDDAGDVDGDGQNEDPDGIATVDDAYWIAATEVTFKLWSEVYKWASGDTDMNGSIDGGETAGTYTFDNPGTQGNSATANNSHPVVSISWQDAGVWCNALTEYVNSITSSDLNCVYLEETAPYDPIREWDSFLWDVVQTDAADGFRMTHYDEWELAARYIQDTGTPGNICEAGDYYPGDYASGATADYNDSTATGIVAWYSNNSNSETQEVSTKNPNALGLYDMSGNVWEWCFGSINMNKHIRGGQYGATASYLRVGFNGGDTGTTSHQSNSLYMGFRIARTAD